MTNPISKAIVKAAVAMGYGKKSDYKGSSVADVLEKFAAIVKDKGGSGGGELFVITGTFSESNSSGGTIRGTVDKSDEEIFAAASTGKIIHFKITGDSMHFVWILSQFYKMEAGEASSYGFIFFDKASSDGFKVITISNGSFMIKSI